MYFQNTSNLHSSHLFKWRKIMYKGTEVILSIATGRVLTMCTQSNDKANIVFWVCLHTSAQRPVKISLDTWDKVTVSTAGPQISSLFTNHIYIGQYVQDHMGFCDHKYLIFAETFHLKLSSWKITLKWFHKWLFNLIYHWAKCASEVLDRTVGVLKLNCVSMTLPWPTLIL